VKNVWRKKKENEKEKENENKKVLTEATKNVTAGIGNSLSLLNGDGLGDFFLSTQASV